LKHSDSEKVALQWAWAVVLFTDPEYTQKVCNPRIGLVLFGRRWPVEVLNADHHYFIWPMWLLFNLAITLIWTILLVQNSDDSVHPVLSRQNTRNHENWQWQDVFALDGGRLMVMLGNALAVGIAVFFIVSSEIQMKTNCVLGGENSEWSFG